jgi:hypothetical protein
MYSCIQGLELFVFCDRDASYNLLLNNAFCRWEFCVVWPPVHDCDLLFSQPHCTRFIHVSDFNDGQVPLHLQTASANNFAFL